jgi:hypothetical protein
VVPQLRPYVWISAVALCLVLGATGLFHLTALSTSGAGELRDEDANVAGVATSLHDDPEPRCASCEIRLDRVAALGHPEDPVLLRALPIIVRDGAGRYYATARNVEDHEIIVYGSDGTVLRSLNRHGSGPGEFRWIQDLFVGAADTLYVAHDGMISVFDSSGAFRRSLRLDPPPVPPHTRIVGQFESGFLLNAVYSQALTNLGQGDADIAAATLPLHVVDHDGRRIRSFGPPDLLDGYRAERGMLIQPTRITALGPGPSIWLAVPPRYRLEKVDAAGRLRRVIGVRGPPDWNQVDLAMTREEAEQRMLDRPPQRRQSPRLTTPERQEFMPWAELCCMAQLNDSILAVALYVAAPDWDEVPITYEPPHPLDERPRRSPGVTLRLSNTIIDVIDVRTGDVFARMRRPGRAFLSRDGLLLDPSFDEFGVIRVHSYELVVNQRRRIANIEEETHE